MVALAAESVHDHRMSGDVYPEIVELMKGIRLIEEAHGLGPDEYWPAGMGPAEWDDLHRQYVENDHKRFVETLLELGANDIADLYLVSAKNSIGAENAVVVPSFTRKRLYPPWQTQ